jgi:hypothetical protein
MGACKQEQEHYENGLVHGRLDGVVGFALLVFKCAMLLLKTSPNVCFYSDECWPEAPHRKL